MECKCQKTWTDCRRRIELIDTLWNVNFMTAYSSAIRMQELIDTLWNVNLVYNKLSVNVVFRINRYIMECKYSYN